MKETKEPNIKNRTKKNSGITLIALIITIIVMLILVSVTISIAVGGGLFENAGKSVGQIQNALNVQEEFANGGINVGGVYYDSKDDYFKNKPSEKNYEVVSEELTGEDGIFKYVKLGKGSIQITRYIGSATTVTIPTNYDGYKVYSVGNLNAGTDSAKRYNIFGEISTSNTTITSIAFEEGIEKIGTAAFNGCSSLTCEIELPNSLKEIGDCAFNLCSNLTGNLEIPEGVTKIGVAAFQATYGYNGTTTGVTLTLPSTLEEIGDYAFNQCIGLTGNLEIPNGIKIIGSVAFQNCKGLNGTLTLPNTLVEIEGNVFYRLFGFNRRFDNSRRSENDRCKCILWL